MFDPDTPTRDNVPNSQFQANLLFELRRICHCACGLARHDIHQEYDTKCMDMFIAKYDPAFKKRPPNLLEFLAADKQIWTQPGGILALVNSGEWTLTEVLNDIVHNRRDIENFMGPMQITEPAGKGKGNSGQGNQRHVKKEIWKSGGNGSRESGGKKGAKGGRRGSGDRGSGDTSGGRGAGGRGAGAKAAGGRGAGGRGAGNLPANWPRNWGTTIPDGEVCTWR